MVCTCRAGADSTPQLKGSLLHVLDRCATAAGGRMLRRWLAAPLADRSSINDRQQAVQVRPRLNTHSMLCMATRVLALS